MKVLLVHQNFPGQMRHLGLALHRRGDRVISIGGPLSAKQAPWQLIRYNELLNKPHPCHRWAEDNLSKVLRAETVGAIMFKLRQEGWTPDIVIGHSGCLHNCAISVQDPHASEHISIRYHGERRLGERNRRSQMAANDHMTN